MNPCTSFLRTAGSVEGPGDIHRDFERGAFRQLAADLADRRRQGRKHREQVGERQK